MKEKTLGPDCGLRILNCNWLSYLPIKENKLSLDRSSRQSRGGGLRLQKLPKRQNTIAKKAPLMQLLVNVGIQYNN